MKQDGIRVVQSVGAVLLRHGSPSPILLFCESVFVGTGIGGADVRLPSEQAGRVPLAGHVQDAAHNVLQLRQRRRQDALVGGIVLGSGGERRMVDVTTSIVIVPTSVPLPAVVPVAYVRAGPVRPRRSSTGSGVLPVPEPAGVVVPPGAAAGGGAAGTGGIIAVVLVDDIIIIIVRLSLEALLHRAKVTATAPAAAAAGAANAVTATAVVAVAHVAAVALGQIRTRRRAVMDERPAGDAQVDSPAAQGPGPHLVRAGAELVVTIAATATTPRPARTASPCSSTARADADADSQLGPGNVLPLPEGVLGQPRRAPEVDVGHGQDADGRRRFRR